MRSYAARKAGATCALLLLAPGWIHTDLGGSSAPSSMEEVMPDIVNVVIGKQARPDLGYRDRQGKVVA